MHFRDVQHQERALTLIRRALRSGRLAHALLFAGPQGVGKERAARALAARLLCHEAPAEELEPCGTCTSCRLVVAGHHPDLHLIHRGLHREHPDRGVRERKGLTLGVEVVRHFLIEPASSSPALGRRRVFIVRDAERMNEAAQNALLKTLEEPPGSATLVLVTAHADRLLPTIRSRCQLISFDPLPAAFVAEKLIEQLDVPRPRAEALARLSEGRLGLALAWRRAGLTERIDAIGQTLVTVHPLEIEAAAKALIEHAQALAIDLRAATDQEQAASHRRGGKVETDELRDALKVVLLVAGAMLRDALAGRVAGEVPGLLDSSAPQALARQRDAEALLAGLEGLARCEQMIDRNVQPQLALEAWLITLTEPLLAPTRAASG